MLKTSKIRWKNLSHLLIFQAIYTIVIMLIASFVFSKPECARVYPDGTKDVFVGEMCEQRWRGTEKEI